MTTDVIRYSGDLKIATASAGRITLDTGVNTGTVVITGNLNVLGTQSYIESVDSRIKDNTLTLNAGETTGQVALGQSGILVDRSLLGSVSTFTVTLSQEAPQNDNILFLTTTTNLVSGQTLSGSGIRAGTTIVIVYPEGPAVTLSTSTTALIATGTSITVTSSTSVSAYASLLYDDTLTWSNTSTVTTATTFTGLWTFKTNNVGSAINVAAIRLSPTAPTRSVPGSTRVLNLLGGGPDAVLSVEGQVNYHQRVIDDNDIPNKKYIDEKFAATGVNTATTALNLEKDDTSIKLFDREFDGIIIAPTSQIVTKVSNQTMMVVQNGSITFGQSLIMVGNTLRTAASNANLTLQTFGTGTVAVNNGISLGVSAVEPQPAQGFVKVYSTSTLGAGSTGILFVAEDNRSEPTTIARGELISARKALVFSIIF
jgi:hypothetical protein